MKKCKWISGLLAIVAIGFVACGNAAGGGGGTPDYITPSVPFSSDDYIKVSKNEMVLNLNKDDEVYMFIYNTGEKTKQKTEYSSILNSTNSTPTTQSLSNFAFKNTTENLGADFSLFLESDDFSEYTCGLRYKDVRNAYKNLPIGIPNDKTSSRTIIGENKYSRDDYKKKASKNDSADFFVYYTNDGINDSVKKIKAKCLYVNNICQIFVETDVYTNSGTTPNDCTIQISEEIAKKTADKFSTLYKAETALLGDIEIPDYFPWIIETPERITILISDLGTYNDNTITAGYFYPADLYCFNDNDGIITYSDNTSGYTNQRLMFTLNTKGYDYENRINEMYSTLGHEFNHMLNYINKSLKHKKSLIVESWLTEMLSAITEDFIPYYLGVNNTVQQSRIPRFLNATNEGIINWYGNTNILNSYGFAYAFGAYLVRNYGGAKLIHEIATNEDNGTESITNALKSCGFPDEDFNSVLTKFALVLVNTDGIISPSLNLEHSTTFNGYKYKFTPIDLYDPSFILRIDSNLKDEVVKNYANPNWKFYYFNNDNSKVYPAGPLFLKQNTYYDNITAGALSATFLEKATTDETYTLNFTPPAENSEIQAYIYVKRAN